jgi:hypothetical protein
MAIRANASDEQDPPATRLSQIPVVLYDQTVGVLGMFAVGAFLAHFITFDWHGAVAHWFDVWNASVRPATKTILDATVVPIWQRIFGWNLVLPLVARDYVSAGMVLLLSTLRLKSGRRSIALPFRWIGEDIKSFSGLLFALAMMPVFVAYTILCVLLAIAVWPLITVWLALSVLVPPLRLRNRRGLTKAINRRMPESARLSDAEIDKLSRAAHWRGWSTDIQILLPYIYLLAAMAYSNISAHGFHF